MTQTAPDAPSTDVVLRDEAAVALGQPLPTMTDVEFAGLWRTAKGLAESGLFKDATKAGQAFAKILAGRDLGLTPYEAMDSLHVIEGKIEAGAHLHAAKVRQREGYDFETWWIKSKTGKAYPEAPDGSRPEIPEGEREAVRAADDDPTDFRAVVGCSLVFSVAGERVGVSTWTIEDTIRAELDRDRGRAGKSNHLKFPRNMFRSRAMTNGVEWYVPEVMGGMRVYGTGEVQDIAGDEDLTTGPATDGGSQIAADGLPTEVEAVLARAGQLGHAGLANRDTARMAVIGQSPDVVQAWLARATTELNRMAAGRPAPEPDLSTVAPGALLTVQDFAGVEHVVEVRDAIPEAGHVTLLVEDGHLEGVSAAIADRYPVNLTVHLLTVTRAAEVDQATEAAAEPETAPESPQEPEPEVVDAEHVPDTEVDTEGDKTVPEISEEEMETLRVRVSQAREEAMAALDADHPDADRLVEVAESLERELGAHEDPDQPSFGF